METSRFKCRDSQNSSTSTSVDQMSKLNFDDFEISESSVCRIPPAESGVGGEGELNPFLHGRRPLLAILSLGQMGKPYSCTMYTEFFA